MCALKMPLLLDITGQNKNLKHIFCIAEGEKTNITSWLPFQEDTLSEYVIKICSVVGYY